MSPEASHTDECTNYQQQQESGNDSAKFQTTENSSKEQQHKSTLTEESIQTLENSLKENITLQLESRLTEQNTKNYQALENSLKESVTEEVRKLESRANKKLQTLENSLKESITEENRKLHILENSFKDLQKQFDSLKQQKSMDSHSEADAYEIQIESEKRKAVKAQETLQQVSAEKEEILKQLSDLENSYHKLKESNHELLNKKQGIEKQLKDVLKQIDIDKKEYETLIKDSKHEVETLKLQIEAEKVKTIETQEVLTQTSTEREEKAKQILTLEENNLKLLNQKQSIEKQLVDALKQMDINKKEYETHIKDYQYEAENEKIKAVSTQEVLIQMSTEREEKTKQILTLEENNFELLNQKQNLEKQLEDVLKQMDIDKKEYETLIKDNKHEVENLKLQIKTEQVKTIKTQEVLTQTSTERGEKAKQILTLEENNLKLLNQKQNIEQQLEDVLKQMDIDKKEYEAHIKDYQHVVETEKMKAFKAQETLTQVTAENEEKAKQILALEKNNHELLCREQNIEKQMEDVLKQGKREYEPLIKDNENEEAYKIQIESEKEKVLKAEEVLVQVSAELQEKAKEIIALNENQHKLKSTVEKLEDALTKSNVEHGSKITEYIKEIQQYKMLNDAEKENAGKAQEALIQVSTELQAKAKEILVLEQNLLHEKQSAEKQMQDILEQCDVRIKEMEDLNKSLQDEKEKTSEKLLQSFTEITNAREIQSTLQDKNSSLLQEKENLESDIKKLQDENNVLTSANKEFDRQLLDSTKNLKNQAELEQEIAKMQNTMLQELDKSKEKYHTLEEKFTEVQNEKQNELKRLQNALELSQSELEKYKLEVENLEKKLQQKQKLTEFHSPLDVKFKSNEKSKILYLNGEDSKVQEQTSVAQDSTEQVKDEEFAGSHAKLVAVEGLVENPVKDLLTIVLGSNQVSVKKETVGQDQPSETAINDQPTETIAKKPVEGKITKTPDMSEENSNNVVVMVSNSL